MHLPGRRAGGSSADTVVRAVPTSRQLLRGAIENGLIRPGPDATYADGDDARWMAIDWPSLTRRVTVLGRELNVVDTGGDGPALVFVHGLGAVSYTHLTLPTTPYV